MLPVWPLPLVRYSPGKSPLWVASAARRISETPVMCEWRAAADPSMLRAWLDRVVRVGARRLDDGTCPIWTIEDDGPYDPATLRWVAEYGRPIPEVHAEAAGIEWDTERTMAFRLDPPFWGTHNIRVSRANEHPGWADQVTIPIP